MSTSGCSLSSNSLPSSLPFDGISPIGPSSFLAGRVKVYRGEGPIFKPEIEKAAKAFAEKIENKGKDFYFEWHLDDARISNLQFKEIVIATKEIIKLLPQKKAFLIIKTSKIGKEKLNSEGGLKETFDNEQGLITTDESSAWERLEEKNLIDYIPSAFPNSPPLPQPNPSKPPEKGSSSVATLCHRIEEEAPAQPPPLPPKGILKKEGAGKKKGSICFGANKTVTFTKGERLLVDPTSDLLTLPPSFDESKLTQYDFRDRPELLQDPLAFQSLWINAPSSEKEEDYRKALESEEGCCFSIRLNLKTAQWTAKAFSGEEDLREASEKDFRRDNYSQEGHLIAGRDQEKIDNIHVMIRDICRDNDVLIKRAVNLASQTGFGLAGTLLQSRYNILGTSIGNTRCAFPGGVYYNFYKSDAQTVFLEAATTHEICANGNGLKVFLPILFRTNLESSEAVVMWKVVKKGFFTRESTYRPEKLLTCDFD